MFDNAERLFFEAETLAKIGATSRALCLHQISLEECSKINQLGAWAVSLLVGLSQITLTRAELYELIWAPPLNKVAERLGTSANMHEPSREARGGSA